MSGCRECEGAPSECALPPRLGQPLHWRGDNGGRGSGSRSCPGYKPSSLQLGIKRPPGRASFTLPLLLALALLLTFAIAVECSSNTSQPGNGRLPPPPKPPNRYTLRRVREAKKAAQIALEWAQLARGVRGRLYPHLLLLAGEEGQGNATGTHHNSSSNIRNNDSNHGVHGDRGRGGGNASQTPQLRRGPHLSAADPARLAQLRRDSVLRWDLHEQGRPFEGCPSWIQEYSIAHKSSLTRLASPSSSSPSLPLPSLSSSSSSSSSPLPLNAPSSPLGADRILIHECPYDAYSGGCQGLGDRVKGLQESFKMAMHSNRTFLLRWEKSAPLEDVLEPAGPIDWRVRPEYGVDDWRRGGGGAPRRQAFTWLTHMTPQVFVSGNYTRLPHRVLSLSHGDMDCAGKIPGPDIGCTTFIPPVLRSCVFHALFKPTAKLMADVAAVKSELFGAGTSLPSASLSSSSFSSSASSGGGGSSGGDITSGTPSAPGVGRSQPYVAVHLRLGGLQGERWKIRGGLKVEGFTMEEVVAKTLGGARDLATAHGFTNPVLVITDNDELREGIVRGDFPGFVSPKYKAKHMALVREPKVARGGELHRLAREAVRSSFTDLALAAGAACLIGSPSGFSHTALAWGRHGCFMKVNGDGKGGIGPGNYSGYKTAANAWIMG